MIDPPSQLVPYVAAEHTVCKDNDSQVALPIVKHLPCGGCHAAPHGDPDLVTVIESVSRTKNLTSRGAYTCGLAVGEAQEAGG